MKEKSENGKEPLKKEEKENNNIEFLLKEKKDIQKK